MTSNNNKNIEDADNTNDDVCDDSKIEASVDSSGEETFSNVNTSAEGESSFPKNAF